MMRRFLLLHMAIAVGLLVLITALNLLVDPTGIRQLALGTGPGICAPGFNVSTRMGKAIGLTFTEPDVLIAGTSRAHAGILTSNPWLQERYGRGYNLGLAGARMEETADYLQFALSYKRPQTMFIEVVPGMFFHSPMEQGTYIEPQTSTSQIGLLAQKVRLYRSALLSKSALQTSASSIVNPKICSNPKFLLNGDRAQITYDASKQRKGSFRIELNESRKFAFYKSFDSVIQRYQTNLNLIDQLIDRACDLDVKTHLFVSPLHVRLVEVFHRSGTWPFVERMMRDLVESREKFSAAGCTITFASFMSYNEITTEPLPSSELAPPMRFYFESNHFRPDVGEMILRWIADEKGDGEMYPDQFGVDLHEDNIEQHLMDLDAQRKRYIEENSTAFDNLGGTGLVFN